jgi:NAD(P)-dependent dehydrogenase (short-subunit alcohol dehydrogenase family)
MRALVTGAASGLGAALTAAMRARGDEVLATDRLPADGVDLVLDITSDGDWNEAVREVRERWGGLDLLVNNAGIAGGGRIELCTIEEWQRMLEVNLLGAVRGVRAFTPVLKEQRSGAVVNVASLAGLVHPAGMGSYNAAKAAVVAYTETIGHELAPYGVTAHVVCPSYFRTNLMTSMSGSDEAVGRIAAGLIEGSSITAEEVAHAVLAGLAAGEELIVPDEMARAAWQLKQQDRTTYDLVMRSQAAKLHEAGQA